MDENYENGSVVTESTDEELSDGKDLEHEEAENDV